MRNNIKIKIILATTILCVLPILASCGKSNEQKQEALQNDIRESLETSFYGHKSTGVDTEFENSGEKGTRNNPYIIGEQIIVPNISGEGNYEGYNFSLTMTVDDILKPSEYESYGLERNVWFDEVVKVTCRVDGDYSNSIETALNQFSIHTLDQDMEDNLIPYRNKSGDMVSKYYTGEDYEWYITGNRDGMTFKYIVIYVVVNGNQREIFVNLSEN